VGYDECCKIYLINSLIAYDLLSFGNKVVKVVVLSLSEESSYLSPLS